MPIQKPVSHVVGGEDVRFVYDDPGSAKKWPTLWEWLTVEAYEDGSPRQTLSMTIFAEEGMLKACLSDRDNNRIAFVTGETLPKLWDAAERALRDGKADWRSQGKRGPGGRARRS